MGPRGRNQLLGPTYYVRKCSNCERVQALNPSNAIIHKLRNYGEQNGESMLILFQSEMK